MVQLLQRVRGKPFYCWHEHKTDYYKDTKRDCCWNKIIGMPRKPGQDRVYPLFNYEYQVFQALEEPSYINARPPTEEERQYFNQKMVDSEQKVKDKRNNIRVTHAKILEEKHNTLIYKQKVGHLAVLKSAGLGLTTLLLRYIAWKCMKDDSWKDTDVIILTGPRQSLSNDLCTMLKICSYHLELRLTLMYPHFS
jgi:hypothetical protein